MRLIRRNDNGEAIGIGVPLVVILGLLGLALLGAGGAAVVASVRKPPEASGRMGPAPKYVSLPEMTLSVGGGSDRQMDVKVLLEFAKDANTEGVVEMGTHISERLGDRIREIGLDRLQGADGANLVKGAVTSVVDREVKPLRVKGVLIEKMLIR